MAGTSRFVGSFTSIMQVGFGSFAGLTVIYFLFCLCSANTLQLVQLYSKTDPQPPTQPESWYWLLFATVFASIGNSILSRLPPKLVLYSLQIFHY